MADDDQPDTSGAMTLHSGYPEAPSPTQTEPDQAEEPPRKSEDTLNESRRKAYFEQLERNYYESADRSNKMMAEIQDSVQKLQQVANAPVPKAPVPTALPAPPNEQQKGNTSEFVFNLLKFGALAVMAFGMRGRGYGHNAIYKGAIGAAIDGYYSGRKDVANAAMQLWEKNRETINAANRQQTASYKEVLADRRLDLAQKMDVINQKSKLLGDYRAFEASKNNNLIELQKMLYDDERLQQHQEDFVRKNRDKLYNILGKPELTAQYWGWVNEKMGGKKRLGPSSSREDIEKAETDYPISEFLRFHEQEELKKEMKKARETGAERQRGKYEETQREQRKEEEEKRHIKVGGTKENPLGLNLGQEDTKKLRSKDEDEGD